MQIPVFAGIPWTYLLANCKENFSTNVPFNPTTTGKSEYRKFMTKLQLFQQDSVKQFCIYIFVFAESFFFIAFIEADGATTSAATLRNQS